jgi:hypothetical protein
MHAKIACEVFTSPASFADTGTARTPGKLVQRVALKAEPEGALCWPGNEHP